MQTIGQLDPLRSAVTALRGDGPIALVPTMGALHQGHLSLIREARARAAHVVVSIFVNPRQFGPSEDLATYPRPIEADSALLEAEGVSLLWLPDPATMYPAGYATTVSVSGVADNLCGAARPGHFDGVATVVAKLFNQVGPDMAFFGEKDWQQLQVVRRLVTDLNIPIRVIGCPTIREEDGLAMSSRNVRLTEAERSVAPALHRAMQAAAEAIRAGAPIAAALAEARDAVLRAGFAEIEYLDFRDAETLQPLVRPGPPARLLAAATLGTVRLIDNIAV